MITINSVPPDVFGELRAQFAEDHQTAMVGTKVAGTISGHGVLAEYTYAEGGQVLSIDVKKHPFFIPVSAIESGLRTKIDSIKRGKLK